MTRVRLAAARILLALDARQTTLAAELEAGRDELVDRRDRALLGELTTGTLRWRNELDAVISAAGRRPVKAIDPPARAVLRLGAYQLRHLTRVPPHAIVNESVEAARALGAARATGLVNAVLRAIIRRGPALSLPARPGPAASRALQLRYLTTTLSHPAWLMRRWLDRHGFDATEAWCAFNNAAPSVAVRSLGRRSIAEIARDMEAHGVTAAPSAHVPEALRLPPGSLGRLSEPLLGEIHIQDEGSQLVALVAGARRGERVLDVCAAPGGKTLVLAQGLQIADPVAASLLVAADVRRARVALLADTMRRAGLHLPLLALDATRPLPFRAVFDCVLLDAPCSGLGTLRRDPDLKWSRTESDLSALAERAAVMIEHAAAVVRPGGRLVYATCSSEPEENGDVVRGLLASHPEFRLEPAPTHIPRDLLDDGGALSTNPFAHGLDAFYAATLVRGTGA